MAGGPASSVIVLESSDDERVPTEEEVNEYAEFLGVDPKEEAHLMWIAREGVVAPVPAPWKACTENGDDVFYFNFETGDSVWDHPSDEKYRLLVEEYRNKPANGSPPASPNKGDASASLESSSVELPKDNLDGLLAGAKGGMSKAQGVLDLGPVNGMLNSSSPNSAPKVLPALELNSANERKRLEAITNEISDDEGGSEDAPASPSIGNLASAGTSPAKVDGNRGSAGVGISPAPKDRQAGLAVDTSLDRSGADSMGSAESSPVATNGAHSQGSRSAPPRGPKVGGIGGNTEGKKDVLERSGQSGKSSNLSEVSEDFPSDFEGSQTSPQAGGIPTPLGDSLEMSATIDDAAPMSLASSASAAKATGAAPASKQLNSRLSTVQNDLTALSKVLAKLREIRVQQREYLQLLQSGG